MAKAIADGQMGEDDGVEPIVLVFMGGSATLLRQLAEALECTEQEAAGLAVSELWQARNSQ